MLTLSKTFSCFKPSRIRSKCKLSPLPARPSVGHPQSSAVNVIPLFGSKRLIRDVDGRSWVLVTAFDNPQRLTVHESMFINAALTAARRQ